MRKTQKHKRNQIRFVPFKASIPEDIHFRQLLPHPMESYGIVQKTGPKQANTSMSYRLHMIGL